MDGGTAVPTQPASAAFAGLAVLPEVEDDGVLADSFFAPLLPPSEDEDVVEDDDAVSLDEALLRLSVR